MLGGQYPITYHEIFVHRQEKHEDGVTVTVKLVCDKDIIAAAKYSENISESDESADQEPQQSLVILIT